MKLPIHKNSDTAEIKEKFQESFDGLKIEFFHHSHESEEGSPKKDMVKESILLSSLNPKLEDMNLHIDPEMTVNQVEEFFEKDLGLHVQVFRKMNLNWIETTATDSYSLSKQIELSRESRGLTN